MDQLKRIPIHRSLNRPTLIAGCERELLLLTGLLAAVLVFVAMNKVTAIAGGVIWLIVIALLRQIAKADPIMSKVYLRHIRYRAFYPSHSSPYTQGAKWVRG